MRITRLLPVVLLTLLAACASTFRSDVVRFHSLSAPQPGQTFTVQPADPAQAGSLEFAQYAGLVRSQLMAQGYSEASAGQAALVVRLDYDIGQGREKIATRPGSYSMGFGGYPYWPGYYRGGLWGPRHWYYSGFYDPFWGPGWYDPPEVYSYTVYNSSLTMDIRRKSDNQSLFEGKAEAVTRTNDPTKIVPNLVTAMFANFPGQSGQTVRVKIDDEGRVETKQG
jgi:hypothetical protein